MSSAEDQDSDNDHLERYVPEEHLFKISPDEAVERYLTRRSEEIRQSTVSSYRTVLSFFVTWCQKREYEILGEIGGKELNEDFYNWRKGEGNDAEGSLSRYTLRENMKAVRRFIRWCENREFIKRGTAEKVDIPKIKPDHNGKKTERKEVFKSVNAELSLQYADKFKYATTRHVVMTLMAEAGCRPSDIRALDVCHYERNGQGGVLKFRDDPQTGVSFGDDPEDGVRLKNGKDGERDVTITRTCCEILDNYISHNRNDVIDEYGRKPLLAPGTGRIGLSTIRKYCYELTRPCVTEGICPSGLSPEECLGYTDRAHNCKENASPKAVRKGYITHLANQGVDIEVISERCDASPSVIKDHYDERSNEERRKARLKDLCHIPAYGGE
ncbi:tyrosine-type recombinase/integrase [Natronosalvus vescus]|uniref:tyrosine-type recombinase/integrase n=1 Tax=Natronosalvus vescus TaxID=2953881 RepID=UPI00209056D6|nr:hypothetical protein [Natronosalvus vescus]